MRFYRRCTEIKAITFDLDDTLYDNRPIIVQLERYLESWLHQHHPVTSTRSKSWWQALKRAVIIEKPSLKHDLTQWRYYQLQKGFVELGYSADEANRAAAAAMEQVSIYRNQVHVPAESLHVLKKLAQNYRLVAITNGNVDVEKVGLVSYFEATFRAGPDGRSKPLPDLFDQASQYLALPSNEILHVGDNLRTDVLGAKRCGFQACWFNPHTENIRTNIKARVLPDVEVTHLKQLLLWL